MPFLVAIFIHGRLGILLLHSPQIHMDLGELWTIFEWVWSEERRVEVRLGTYFWSDRDCC